MCGALFLAAICHGGKADLSSPTSDLCFLLFAFSVPAAAQQAGKVYRIGFMSLGEAEVYRSRIVVFRQGLRELK